MTSPHSKQPGGISQPIRNVVQMTLVEFNPTVKITHTVHVAKTLGNYNIIVGQDLLHEIGIDIRFSTKTMCWNDVEADMKNICARKKTCST